MNKVILSTAAALALTLATTQPVMAEQKNNKKLNPWTDCGIGAMIFTSNGAAAAISNIIWDLGTTAVSSNISSQNSCASDTAKTAMFIKATMPVLEQEISIGEGEYLTAMLELRGCESTSHTNIINAVRKDIKNKEASDAESLYNTLENHVQTSFSNSCSNA